VTAIQNEEQLNARNERARDDHLDGPAERFIASRPTVRQKSAICLLAVLRE